MPSSTTNPKPVLAFLGLGAMGGAMAAPFIEAGYPARLFDPSAAAVEKLASRGGITARSPAEAVAGADVAFACLPSPEISVEVGASIAGSGLRTYIEMSTIGSAAVEKIAAGLSSGTSMLDAPVSGGPRGVDVGTLSIMVAGDRAVFEATKPLFDVISRNIFYIGPRIGTGQITKLANNMISAASMASAYEAAVLAVKAGVDAETFIDVVNASTGRNTATTHKFPAAILNRSFDYGGRLSTTYKDTLLCLQESHRLKVPMWVGTSVFQLWFHAVTQGRSDDDYTTLIKMIEEWGDVVVGTDVPKEPRW